MSDHYRASDIHYTAIAFRFYLLFPGHHADGALQAGEASCLQADLQDHEEAARCFPKHRLSHTLLQHHAPRTAAPRPGKACVYVCAID